MSYVYSAGRGFRYDPKTRVMEEYEPDGSYTPLDPVPKGWRPPKFKPKPKAPPSRGNSLAMPDYLSLP